MNGEIILTEGIKSQDNNINVFTKNSSNETRHILKNTYVKQHPISSTKLRQL
jgi:hypothetical protein